jgi:hypothetical protein
MQTGEIWPSEARKPSFCEAKTACLLKKVHLTISELRSFMKKYFANWENVRTFATAFRKRKVPEMIC